MFILLEFPSPSRRIFIGSHSLPPLWFAVSVLRYENKFGAVRGQRNSQALGSTGKKKQHEVRYMGLLLHVLQLLFHLHLHLLLLAAISELSSYLDSDTVTCFDDEFNIMY
jgi:hypothetical protein